MDTLLFNLALHYAALTKRIASTSVESEQNGCANRLGDVDQPSPTPGAARPTVVIGRRPRIER